MVFKINKSCAHRTTDSDWWDVPYARFSSASPYRMMGYRRLCKQGKTVVHFIAYPYSGSNRQLYRLCTETIVRSTCNAFLGCSTYHSIEIHFRRTGQHHVQPYRNSQRMQRMVTIQAIILKTGFQGEMLVQTTFHAYPGRERHMEIPFRQGSADACFQCPITGLRWRYSHRLCRFFLRRWQHSIYTSILMARI